MRRKATLAITLAAAMAATAVPAMADDKVSITIFNSKMEIQSQFEDEDQESNRHSEDIDDSRYRPAFIYAALR